MGSRARADVFLYSWTQASKQAGTVDLAIAQGGERMQARAAGFVLCCALLVASPSHPGLAQNLPPPGPSPGMPPSPPYGPTSLEPNTNRPGDDFSSFALPEPNVALCRSACGRNATCAAYTYVNPGVQGASAMCWLKSVVPQPVADTCCTSGYRKLAARGTDTAGRRA